MKVGKREEGKIYAYRMGGNLRIYHGKNPLWEIGLCYIDFARITGIKLKPSQTIEIEVRAKGGVG